MSEGSRRQRVGPLLTLLLVLGGCQEDLPPEPYSYPLSEGNRWQYERNIIMTAYTDTLTPGSIDSSSSISAEALVTVMGEVLLRDGFRAYQLDGSEYGGSAYGNDTTGGTSYYRQEDDGLYLIGYQGFGTFAIPKESPEMMPAVGSLIAGRKFATFRALSAWLQLDILGGARVASDSIYYEDLPVKILHYPPDVGSSWTYREANNPWRIDKFIEGQVEVTVPAGTYDCFTVRWLYDFHSDGEWDTDIVVVDYIGKLGLVRRETIITGVEWQDKNGDLHCCKDYRDSFLLLSVSVE